MKFRFQVRDGKHFIITPVGVPVLRYVALTWGRLGNLREFSLWTLDEDGQDYEQILCVHAELARSILAYLNGRQINSPYDADELQGVLPILDAIRQSHLQPPILGDDRALTRSQKRSSGHQREQQ